MGGENHSYQPVNSPGTKKVPKNLPANPSSKNLFSGEETENRELPLRFY
jgi:hypothetical protein